MWNNLRARHYSVLILLAIVALETFAITVDKLVFAESEEAFEVESSFQNNSFIQSFRMADANESVLPVRINDLVSAHTNKISHKENNSPIKLASALKPAPVENKVSKSVSANFVVAANNKDSYVNFVEYSVQPGDSLSNIAELFGTKTEKIKQANKLDNEGSIRAGQTIKVPMQSKAMSYTVKKGDSLSRIASKFNVSLENLIKENNLKTHVLMAEQKIKIPVENFSNFKLAKVDTKTSAPKELPMVKSEKPKKIDEPKKLQMVKLDNKLPMATAAASAKKAEISFGKDDIVTKPATTVAKANIKNEKESVELNLSKTDKVASKETSTAKNVKATAEAIAKETSTAKNVKATTETIAKETSTAKNVKATAEAISPVKPTVAKADDSEKTSSDTKTTLYTVSKGDNLSKIASKFNTTVAQIQSDNNIDGDKLKVGQSLKITPNQKLYRVIKNEKEPLAKADTEAKTIISHKVQIGESLSTIAKKYNASISDIVTENKMTNTVLMTDQTIKVPVSKKKNFKITTVSSKSNSGTYAWNPPTKGWLSSNYGWRTHPVSNTKKFHAGVDIAAPKGTAIHAVAPGRVIYVGSRGGYGKLVIIAHANGISTRYGHCSQILVKNGQMVKEGQLIAKVGATGVATGNHCHFEVRKNGKTQNPMKYLKK